ncbi:Alkaline phosphatase synthesis sensor protein PhoR [Anaerohalosphaera lusitana]|uniref:histidine kinase n=1 Tax=Anaerohalosphaera lusitana TaxID=1936003 RepID=A0A1U9NNM3_9BACT|nr:ATP-binding protein [Anaerohalosphaera lusitana]AQT69521.1 Alkaline phosphatase synthesis sensor protein PhoR [Anaerohalosphaera lusitana]
MKNRRLLWQIFTPFVLVTLAALISAAFYISYTLRDFHLDQIEQQLLAQAYFAEELLTDSLANQENAYLNEVTKELGQETGTRITIIAASGQVVAESHEQAEEMELHADRPEIVQALEGSTGFAIRPSTTLGQDMVYVAIPMMQDGNVIGVVRTSVSAASIDNTLAEIFTQIAFASIIIAFAAAIVSLGISRRITLPLEKLREGANRFAQGDFSHTLPHAHAYEIDALVTAMNRMAKDLDSRIKTMIRQHNEQQAILSSMAEAVIAVDNNQQIISINEAAEKMLNIDKTDANDRRLSEVVRNPMLNDYIQTALTEETHVEGPLTLHDTGLERHLRVQGTLLRDAHNKKIGAVVVLNDITQIRRLERVRKDFVANVSHELKTPVTSIKGFIETLLDGALDDPEDAARFIKIIERQTNRLNHIIQDLLTLSRIEEQTERTSIEVVPANIKGLLSTAAQLCQLRASEKNVEIKLDCENDLIAPVNPSLLEQALVNLIDNAIKYSPQDDTVTVNAHQDQNNIVFSVSDNGCGIKAKYLPRLFERFYRVDKARSRKLGGTGLGLAIVKHISQAHGGTVSVESTPDIGSTFTITIPTTN